MDSDDTIIFAVKERLGLTDEQIKAANFIYWLTCLCEHMIANPSAKAWGIIAKKGGYDHGESLTNFMFYEMSFTSKMKVLRKQIDLMGMDQKKFKPFFEFTEKLNSIRNPLAHYKFAELKWNGKSLEDPKTRESVIEDFIEMSEKIGD